MFIFQIDLNDIGIIYLTVGNGGNKMYGVYVVNEQLAKNPEVDGLDIVYDGVNYKKLFHIVKNYKNAYEFIDRNFKDKNITDVITLTHDKVEELKRKGWKI